jgi:hypothetical protein
MVPVTAPMVLAAYSLPTTPAVESRASCNKPRANGKIKPNKNDGSKRTAAICPKMITSAFIQPCSIQNRSPPWGASIRGDNPSPDSICARTGRLR